MHRTKSVCLLVRGTEDSTESRGDGLQGRRHVVLNIEVVVQQRHGVDGCNGVRRLCLSAALEDDFVGSLSLGAEGGVLQGCNAGVGRQGIEENDLEERLDVWKEASDVVEELSGQLVTNGAGLAEFPGKLVRSPSKVTQQGLLPSLGVRGLPGRAND